MLDQSTDRSQRRSIFPGCRRPKGPAGDQVKGIALLMQAILTAIASTRKWFSPTPPFRIEPLIENRLSDHMVPHPPSASAEISGVKTQVSILIACLKGSDVSAFD